MTFIEYYSSFVQQIGDFSLENILYVLKFKIIFKNIFFRFDARSLMSIAISGKTLSPRQ